MNEKLHIVCLDAPSPPDYGGAIDMYYKIPALASTGRKIILHYFNYKKDRGIQGLEEFCTEIYAYDRKSILSSFSGSPYIVASRVNNKLVERLNKDDHPVLLEGIHCTGIIPFLKKGKKTVIRLHNDEAVYYSQLARAEQNMFRRTYFKREGKLLQRYQAQLPFSIPVACLSLNDMEMVSANYGFRNTSFIPCFIPWKLRQFDGENEKSIRKFCLYHGNLAVKENEEAALWLINSVFKSLQVPLIIAGHSVSAKLRSVAAGTLNVTCIADPSMEKLHGLIRDAHIHVLPSMNHTGVKLKLLHALFEGRFCITNTNGISGSGITNGIIATDKSSEWITSIQAFMNDEYGAELMNERKELAVLYNNNANALKLNELL